MIPTGFESEQVAEVDHDGRHGDRYERQTDSYTDAVAGVPDGTTAVDFAVAPASEVIEHDKVPAAARDDETELLDGDPRYRARRRARPPPRKRFRPGCAPRTDRRKTRRPPPGQSPSDVHP